MLYFSVAIRTISWDPEGSQLMVARPVKLVIYTENLVEIKLIYW